MSTNVGSATGYLDLDISGFLAGLQSAQSAANTQTRNIATKIGDNMISAGKSLSTAGTTLTKYVTTPVAGAGVAIVKLSANFESAMSKVSAISGATGSDLEALNAKAQEMGAKTKFSATEAAEAFTYMAMAGWKTEAMLEGIDGIMNLAAADGLDLATTSDIVTDALTAFGMSASESGHFADILAKASSNANTNVSMLGESFKYVAPVAGSLGYSAKDTAIALGLMANAGIKASQSGTSLRGALTRMIKPTDDAAAVMEKYGISMTNTDGTMKSLGDIMVDLRNNMGDLSEAEQAQAAATLFGQEAMSGMLAIINASDKDFEKLTKEIYNADGAAKQMADTMLDNLSGQVTILKSSLEGLALQFGEILLPYVKQFTSWIQNLTQKLQELTPEQKEQVVQWAAIAAIIGPVLVVVGKLVSILGTTVSTLGKIPKAISIVKTQFSTLGTAIAGISVPVVATVALIAALIAAFINLWQTNEEFRDNIIAIWNQVQEIFGGFVQGITDRLNALGITFDSTTGLLKVIWQGFCDFLAPVFEGAFQLVADTLQVICDAILGIFDVFVAIFQGDWEGAWEAVKSIFTSVWEFIKSTFENILNTMKGILDVVCSWFGTTWENTWNNIKDFFSNVWNSIVSFFTNVWDTIKNIVTVGIMFIVELFNAAFQLITLPFRFIWENCKETIISTWTIIKDFIVETLNVIETFISNVWNSIKAFIEPILNGIKTTITNVWNAIKTNVTNVLNGIKNVVSTVWNNVKSIISGAIDSVKSSISNGLNSAKNTVSNIFDSIKNKISSTLETAKNTVKSGIDKIRSFFNFSWSLPRIALPHFTISGSFSLNPPSVPSFGIEWYKKAMSGGMILNSPTIFGFDPTTGNFLGAGEAGSETIVGTASLMKMIRNAVIDAIGPMVEATYQLIRTSHDLGYITNNAFAKQTQIFEQIMRNVNDEPGGGHTFNFYSPEAIDEVEAAHQMKKAMRELAEGF